ncbi:DegV family protein [Lachnoclostridium sp. Marseille-P6806]|uniref:DegV family protein n=1 Tax=Lachnoclostridium sp. Marseille-P6806 TaxID=2364793 RepID=UPI0010300950|nr:DegV family protein [Lachnoclostridium sp. Marseille-P6806]
MARVQVITDSNSGITQKQAEELGIRVVPMPFMFGRDDTTYYEDINLSRAEFFERLETEEQIMTSQPAPNEVLKVWDAALEECDEVVYIPMSSGLSGSCQSARMLSSDYDGKVQVVNNQRISVTQKASVFDAMQLAAMGKRAAEIRQILEDVRFDSSIYIMLDTLKYLKKGGRITPAAAAIGSLLRIRPVLQIKGERLDAFSKARTTAQGRSTMLSAMKNDIEKLYGGTAEETVHLYAVHANVPELEEEWAAQVQEFFPNFHVEKDALSLSVSCHIGPGALAIACSKKLEI